MEKLKALVVDDEINILELIKYNLEENEFDVTCIDNGLKAIETCNQNNFDIIILDLMLPGKNGLDICRELRLLGNKTPIIILTAKTDEVDKIIGLEFGADDYVTKPFSVRELMARVKAVLRRTDTSAINNSKEEMNIIKLGDLIINTDSHEVQIKGKIIGLALKEFELLLTLVQNKGRVLTRDRLLEIVWGYEYEGETRTVDVHIRYLRKKLGDDEDIIQTIRGVGYKIK
jgi:two-component system alkaline phosphatase synthesis response regulator PhoP